MAIRTVVPRQVEDLPTVDDVMERFGFDRDAAELYLAAKSGVGLIGDRVCVPADQRDAVLQELEEAEAAYLAAMEKAAKDPE